MTAFLFDLKRCKICRNVKAVECFASAKGSKGSRTGREANCKKCRNEQRKLTDNYKNKMNEYCNTVTGRANRIFNGAKRRAKEKNLDFEITLEHIKKKLEHGRCERTNLRFEFVSSHSLYAPSLDRIDNSLGYTIENTQLVCCAYNMGKKSMTDKEFLEFILKAAKNLERLK